MANYVPSALATAQAQIGRKYNEAELRRKMRPAVSLALRNQDFAIPNHQELKTAQARAVDVFYFTRRAAGAATAKVASHTGNKGDSNKVTLAYVTHTETFRISRKQAQNNVFGWQQMFNNEVEQAVMNLMDRHETSALAYLVANRKQTATAGVSGSSWDAINFAAEVPVADKSYFFQHAKATMMANNYRPEFDVVADLTAYTIAEQIGANGSGNATNTAFQLQGLNIAPTTEVISATYSIGSSLFMPAGTFAGLNWNDPLNRQGMDEGMNNVGMFGTLLDPFGSGAIFDVSVYSDRADESAAGGNVQDVVDQWEIALTVGYALPPISTASDSPVILMAIV